MVLYIFVDRIANGWISGGGGGGPRRSPVACWLLVVGCWLLGVKHSLN